MTRRRSPLPGNWQTLRRHQLAADNWTCTTCGWHSPTGTGLEVDHYGHRDDHTQLRTLCAPCHTQVTLAQATAARQARAAARHRPQQPHPGLRN